VYTAFDWTNLMENSARLGGRLTRKPLIQCNEIILGGRDDVTLDHHPITIDEQGNASVTFSLDAAPVLSNSNWTANMYKPSQWICDLSWQLLQRRFPGLPRSKCQECPCLGRECLHSHRTQGVLPRAKCQDSYGGTIHPLS
jgi:hypothetical protein